MSDTLLSLFLGERLVIDIAASRVNPDRTVQVSDIRRVVERRIFLNAGRDIWMRHPVQAKENASDSTAADELLRFRRRNTAIDEDRGFREEGSEGRDDVVFSSAVFTIDYRVLGGAIPDQGNVGESEFVCLAEEVPERVDCFLQRHALVVIASGW